MIRAPREKRGIVATLGALAIDGWDFHRRLYITLHRALASILAPGIAARKVVARIFLAQIFFTGYQALLLVSVIALLLGGTIIVQTNLMSATPPPEVLGKILVAVVVRELAPLGTAIIVCGRSGTAIATELGNMKVNSEVLALSSLGIDPMRYVVLPRLGGAVVSVLLLMVYFSTVAILGGYLVSNLIISPSFEALRAGFTEALRPADFGLYLAKGVGLGTIVGLLACHFGLDVKASPTEVPQKASSAVVMAILGCVVWSTTVTVAFYAIYGPPVRY